MHTQVEINERDEAGFESDETTSDLGETLTFISAAGRSNSKGMIGSTKLLLLFKSCSLPESSPSSSELISSKLSAVSFLFSSSSSSSSSSSPSPLSSL